MASAQLILILLIGATIALSGYRFYGILAPVFRGPPARRFDHPGQRAAGAVADVGLHRRLFRKRYSGLLHAMLFFGFVVLFTAIVQSFGSGLIPGFSLSPIGGDTWIALAQDIFAVLIIVALGMAAYQRAVLRPARFDGSNAMDAWLIYVLVLCVVGTMLLENAFRIVESGTHTQWRPVSGALAALVTKTGGVARRISTELERLKEQCKRAGADSVTVDMVGAPTRGVRR